MLDGYMCEECGALLAVSSRPDGEMSPDLCTECRVTILQITKKND